MIEFLAGTGIRVGELLQLRVGDLVLRERSGWITVREGKRGGYRQIPLTKAVTPTQIRQWMLESGDSSSLRFSE